MRLVLGSILLGIATVNQAGAIGAVGAGIMGSYRLYDGRKHKYTPAIVSIISLIFIILLVEIFTPYLVYLIAPGFFNETDKFNLAVEFTRITFPLYLHRFSTLSSPRRLISKSRAFGH